MPNHCETDMYIRGAKEEVDAFAKWIEDVEGEICRALIPYPEPYKTMDEEARAFSFFGGEQDKEKRRAAEDAYRAKYGHTKDGYNSGGYDWCCENWGTKWGIYDAAFTPDTKRGALFAFQSAWSPPSTEVFRALSEKFPNLTFELEWFEGGGGFCGGMTFWSEHECEDYERVHGEPDSQWSGDYSGSRGG